MKLPNIIITLFITTFMTASLEVSATTDSKSPRLSAKTWHQSSMRHLDDNNFEATISKGIVIVDFYAEWCPPCKKFGPIFEQIAEEMSSKLTFAKTNVDHAPSAAQTYRVTSIPTLILFKDGKEVMRRLGGGDAASLKEFIQSASF